MTGVTLEETANAISEHLNEIATYFVPEMKITFIARLPDNPGTDFMMTVDDLDEIIKVVERRKGH